MTSTEIALLLNNDSDKIARIGEIIGRKIPSRDSFQNLNDFERTFVYVDVFEKHTSNGGFEEFFWNSSGQFSHEILEAYEKIGAIHTASLIYDAFRLFGEIPIPKSIEHRRAIINGIDPKTWEVLDREFYKSKDPIISLILEFVAINPTYFD